MDAEVGDPDVAEVGNRLDQRLIHSNGRTRYGLVSCQGCTPETPPLA